MMPHENVLQNKREGTRGPLPSNPNPVSSKEGGGGNSVTLEDHSWKNADTVLVVAVRRS